MKWLDNIFVRDKACSEELNILDIEEDIFYSLDGYISLYIKVDSIPFEYLSNDEKIRIVKKLNSEIAGERDIIKIIVMTLPISTKEIADYLNKIRNGINNSFKRSLLLKEIRDIERLSFNNEMLEKQVIVQLFKKNGDDTKEQLEKRGKEFVLKLQNAGISSYILDKYQILQFFNCFLNMKLKEDKFDIWGDEYK